MSTTSTVGGVRWQTGKYGCHQPVHAGAEAARAKESKVLTMSAAEAQRLRDAHTGKAPANQEPFQLHKVKGQHAFPGLGSANGPGRSKPASKKPGGAGGGGTKKSRAGLDGMFSDLASSTGKSKHWKQAAAPKAKLSGVFRGSAAAPAGLEAPSAALAAHMGDGGGSWGSSVGKASRDASQTQPPQGGVAAKKGKKKNKKEGKMSLKDFAMNFQ